MHVGPRLYIGGNPQTIFGLGARSSKQVGRGAPLQKLKNVCSTICTAASNCSFTPARCCNTVPAGVLTRVMRPTCYKRQGGSALSIALVIML